METSKEVPVISLEEFKKDLKNRLITFEAFKRFKAINRAIKRGLVSPFGELYPKRPLIIGRILVEERMQILEKLIL